jgi:hypothetical protein
LATTVVAVAQAQDVGWSRQQGGERQAAEGWVRI